MKYFLCIVVGFGLLSLSACGGFQDDAQKSACAKAVEDFEPCKGDPRGDWVVDLGCVTPVTPPIQMAELYVDSCWGSKGDGQVLPGPSYDALTGRLTITDTTLSWSGQTQNMGCYLVDPLRNRETCPGLQTVMDEAQMEWRDRPSTDYYEAFWAYRNIDNCSWSNVERNGPLCACQMGTPREESAIEGLLGIEGNRLRVTTAAGYREFTFCRKGDTLTIRDQSLHPLNSAFEDLGTIRLVRWNLADSMR